MIEGTEGQISARFVDFDPATPIAGCNKSHELTGFKMLSTLNRSAASIRWRWLMLIALSVWLGCGRSRDNDAQAPPPATLDGKTASEYLQSVYEKYQHSADYCDQGLARLTYRVNGEVQTEKAPLSVHKHQQSLYIEAYDVRIWIDAKLMTAWFHDPATNHHDGQVLRRKLDADRMDPQLVLSDPVISGKLSAGLAGPPPQLDWLFADRPMQRLFEGQHKIAFGRQQELAGQKFVTVEVDADGQQYRFWIDPEAFLIHRVDLPSVTSPETPSRNGNLTLELAGASFASDNSTSVEELPAKPRFVGQFIPLPVQEPAPGLGRAVKKFQITHETGKLTVSNRGSDRPITVILMVSDDDLSIQNVATMNEWVSAMSNDMAANVRSVVVIEGDSPGSLPRDLLVPVIKDDDGVARRAFKSTNRGELCQLVVIDSQGRIAWLQQTMSPAHFALLGPILGDILDGVDVPGRLLDQWRSSVANYRNLLGAETARHNSQWQTN